MSALAAALPQESDPRVREAMFTALARIATAASAEVLIPYLKSEEASLRTGAIDALRAMPAALAPSLPGLLVDSDPDVRLLSCELVRCLPDAEANRLLWGVLDDDTDKNVCASALEVLADIGQPEAMPSLRRCAARFADDPFITFSIDVAIDRLGALTPSGRE